MRRILIISALWLGSATAHPIDEPFERVSFQPKQSMDVDGSYKYDFTSDDFSKSEVRHPDGTVVGAYQYIDPDGILQRVRYAAGVEGVHMLGTNVPHDAAQPVHDTAEVAHAKQDHYTAVQRALQLIGRAAAFEAEYKRLHPNIEEPEMVFKGFDPNYEDIVRAQNTQ